MTTLYIGYWGANEGLSQATINPHLKILEELGVKQVIYISIERNGEKSFQLPKMRNLIHVPLHTNKFKLRIINKFYDFLILKNKILRIAKNYNVNVVICRSSLAGYFGNYLFKELKLSYAVESFEPHADYMEDSGVWSKSGISSKLSRMWEGQQKKNAKLLMPVTNNYKDQLLLEGVDARKVQVMPCAVDYQKFRFNFSHRETIRKEFSIDEKCKVGIYVGKFGGIYYSLTAAFEIFKAAYEYFSDFSLIMLSPQSKSAINSAAKNCGFPLKNLVVKFVTHMDVPCYLSAADFAFSLHKPTVSMKFVSPIKNGEYWANGLPILISEGIGDDAAIIKKEPQAGAIVYNTSSSVFEALNKISNIISDKNRSSNLARRYRSFDRAREVYENLLKE